MAGSSVNFKAVTSASHAVSHASRSVEPSYLLPPEKSLGTIIVLDDKGMVSSTLEAKLALASRQALRTKNYSPVWEGIINLRRPEQGEDADAYRKECKTIIVDWCDSYQKMTGHTVLRADIHLDEGHMVDGDALLNSHAHIIADKTNEKGRVIKINAPELRKIQDMTAKVTRLERGKNSLETGRKHIGHQAYRYLAERGRLEAQPQIDKLEKDLAHVRNLYMKDSPLISGLQKEIKNLKSEALKEASGKASGEAIQGDYVALKKAHEVALAKLTSAEAQAAKVPSLEAQATQQAQELVRLQSQYQRDREALKASGEATQGDYVALKKAHEVALAKLTSAEAQAAKVARLERQVADTQQQATEAQQEVINTKLTADERYKKLRAQALAIQAERDELLAEKATLSVAPPARSRAAAPQPVPQVPTPPAPALPTPALAERLQESFKALVDWVKHQGGTLKEINAERADCYGAVVQLDDLHAVQRVGKSIYSIHLLDQLDKVPALNDPKTEIKYRNGMGKVVGSLGPSIER